jgi:enoyl-CoA hydratase/carnithine racemase
MASSNGALLRLEDDGSGGPGLIGEVVLDRPEAMNALNTASLADLAAHFTALGANQSVRVVIVSAAGERAFCAGADLKERAAMSDAQIMSQRPAFRSAFAALLALPQPAIAAVHGFALGGGCELALCCDVIVADATAVFGLPEATVGLVPGCGGTQLLARRVGPGRAAEMIFSGRQVAAGEAVEIGLADRLVAGGQARKSAFELARQIAANSPVAVRESKRALRNGAGLPLAAALDVEDAAWRTAASSPDRREGIAAFAEKRRPAWPSAGVSASSDRQPESQAVPEAQAARESQPAPEAARGEERRTGGV